MTSQARAQGEPSVTMTLLSQPAWTGHRRPLDLSFQATNDSTVPLQSLTVELLVLAPARSRSLYELSIRSDVTSVITGYPFPQQGTLQPGQSRTFRIKQQDLGVLVQRGESALYPLRVELRSRDVAVGVLRTPMVFLIERPEVPLNLAWTWVLSEPLQYDPNGVFQPGTIEADIASGGQLDLLVEALSRIRNRAVDLVVSPLLLDQLRRMAGGYRIAARDGVRTTPKGTGAAAQAQRMLGRLQDVASRPGVELLAYPMGDPSLPSLLRAGMGSDLDKLLEEGRQLVAPNFVTFPKFESPPTARLLSGSSSLTGVLPDPEVQGFIRANPEDPRLTAQLALGELAASWFDAPGTPGRGAALMFAEKLAAPPSFYPAFVSLIRSSPWLRPMTASSFAASIPPQFRRQIPARNYPSFSPLYVNRLERAKTSLAHFSKAIHGAKPLIERLRQNLLLSESGAFLADAVAGQQFIGSVDRTARRVYDRIGISSSVVTLTSRAGFIPLTLVNDSGYTATVVLQFISDRRLELSGGASHTIA